MNEAVDYRLAELERRVLSLVRVGTVVALDESTARVTVAAGGLLTAPLPWLTRRAGHDREWWAPEPGEQVLLLCPGGETEQGLVLPALYQAAYPPPAQLRTVARTTFADGAVVEYDRVAHALKASLPVGSVVVTAPEVTVIASTKVTLTTPRVELAGDLLAAGQVSDAVGTMAAMRLIYDGHTHSDPQGGATGVPAPPMGA